MGYRLGLYMNPDQIPREQWAAFYDEAVMLLGKFRLGIRFARRKTERHKLWMTTHRLEAEDEYGHYFAIAGDSLSGKLADTFKLYRDLNVYAQRQKRMSCHSGTTRHIYWQEGESIEVFAGKTQGYPYHKVICAVIALAETRFPGNAMATGNLELADWKEALNWANRYLSPALLAPINLDVNRLWLLYAAHYSGDELVSKLNEQLKRPVDLFLHLSAEAPERITGYIYSNLRESDGTFLSAATIGATCWMRDYMYGVRDLGRLLTDVCLRTDGPQYKLETVLMSLDFAGIFHDNDHQPEAGSDSTYHLSLNEGVTIIAAVTGRPIDEVAGLLKRIHTDQHSVRGRANSLLNFDFRRILDDDHEEDISKFAAILREQKEKFVRSAQSGKCAELEVWRDMFMNICEKLEVILSEENWERLDRERNPDLFGFLSVTLFAFDQEPALGKRFRNRLLDMSLSGMNGYVH